MLEWWNQICLTVGDWLLGWSLGLPSDLTLLVVAVASAAVLTVLRLVATNQDLLGRAAADKKRLKQLIRQAKQDGDREAVRRDRKTASTVGLLALRAEGRLLLVAILPLAVLATWCMFRLGFHPPRAGKPVEFAVYTLISASGQLAHVVPQPGVECDAWIARVEAVRDEESVPKDIEPPYGVEPPYGLARWQLRAEARPEPYPVVFRLGDTSGTHDLLVGQAAYTVPAVYQGNGTASAVQMSRSSCSASSAGSASSTSRHG